MIDRLRGMLQPRRAQPTRHIRPNELRPEIVRAERLRREAMQHEQAARAAESESESARPRPEPMPAPAARQPRRAPDLMAALRTRSGLRQAVVMHEILGPPRAMRRPDGSGDRS